MRKIPRPNFYTSQVRALSTLALLLLLALLPGCNTGNPSFGLIGKPGPALHLPSQPLAADRGHVVLINFWASWCGPCLQEFPSLVQLQQKLPQVRILAVSFDEDPEAYQAFLIRHPFPLHMALDSSGISSSAYGVTAPPETYVLDTHGIVRRKFIGAQDWTTPEILGYLRALQ
jgi:cytochrome c biogenesis protein CcmG/thiol:disulfide interchange protein DsbE